MQELPIAVEAGSRRPRRASGPAAAPGRIGPARLRRRDVDQPDAPGLHRERLAAAQPAPQEVAGENQADEELQQVARAARGGVAPAAGKEEQPGREEADREQQHRFVPHARQAPREAGVLALTGAFSPPAAAAGGTRFWRSCGGSAWYSAQAWRSLLALLRRGLDDALVVLARLPALLGAQLGPGLHAPLHALLLLRLHLWIAVGNRRSTCVGGQARGSPSRP